MFRFGEQWYITYHAAAVDKAMGWNAGYRSTFVDKLELNEAGLPAPSKGTYAGVEQVKPLNPYEVVNGATAISMAGTITKLANEEDRKFGTGSMAVVSEEPQGWVAVSGADFGEKGVTSVRMTVRSEKAARIEIIPDSIGNEPIAVLVIPASETNTEVAVIPDKQLTGIHNIFFRFSEAGTTLVEWQFE
jgi:arabinoxylan arabinofuranohydrolase